MSSSISLDFVRTAISAFREEAAECARLDKEARQNCADIVWSLNEKCKEELLSLERQFEAAGKQAGEQRQQLRREAFQRMTQELKAMEEDYVRKSAEMQSKLKENEEVCVEKLRQKTSAVIDDYEKRSSELEEREGMLMSSMEELSGQIVALKEEAARFASRFGMPPQQESPFLHIEIPSSGKAMLKLFSDSCASHRESLRRLKARKLKFFSQPVVFTACVLILAAHGGGALAIHIFGSLGNLAWFLAGSLAVCLFVAIESYVLAKRRVLTAAAPLLRELSRLELMAQSGGRKAERKADERRKMLSEERVRRIIEAEEFCRSISDNVKDKISQDQKELKTERDSRERSLKTGYDKLVADCEMARHATEAESLSELEGRRQEARDSFAGSIEEAEAEAKAISDGAVGRYEAAMLLLSERSREANLVALNRFPPWNYRRWEHFQPPTGFPDSVAIGKVKLDVKAVFNQNEMSGIFPPPSEPVLGFPASLSFPAWGSLLIKAAPERSQEAAAIAKNSMMRLLASFAPGSLRFRIIDPVGLGRDFAGFMLLSDYDRDLSGGRVFTEEAHLENLLADLTEHMEKVIQKCLRGEFQSLSEYNHKAGEMGEAYRYLVVADFPRGWTEAALSRLSSIVRSGSRCGVHTIIITDPADRPVSPSFDMGELEQSGMTLALDGQATIESGGFESTAVEVESPPPPQKSQMLLKAIGENLSECRRVELPFEHLVPPEGRYWATDSTEGIRVPLGKAGVDRLHAIELGRGTAQHVLVAGKTGSGKSTLFHVLITASSLWYGPDELELYLVDFKKGVEFKVYARRLPHARAVAVESDREFGLSVLRRVDLEISRRGERFRAAGTQDIKSFRRSKKGAKLPRVLLVIDEFQEFFTEEDGLSQEAALLLDRIVRQGRAFGVHAILGSQTLAGAYTLARSTLDQMAVRIALQCSETDSGLILSDDNSAARLLSRPGEAIYNDMSGRVDGNQPFQVSWLPEETHNLCLQHIADLQTRRPFIPAEPQTVFDGSAAADMETNPRLMALLRAENRTRSPGPAMFWLGEACSIKPPTEVTLRRQSGGNLILVGSAPEAAMAIMASSIVTIGSSRPPNMARFVVLDASMPEQGFTQYMKALSGLVPQGIELIPCAEAPLTVAALRKELVSRQDGAYDGMADIFLYAYGMQRLRRFRPEDEMTFSTEREAQDVAPERALRDLLKDGPDSGIHILAWCDTAGGLLRMTGRQGLREFGLRVLFQMGTADSSELMDSPEASRLGPNRALLFREEDGSIEKFRPYGLPPLERLKRIVKV